MISYATTRVTDLAIAKRCRRLRGVGLLAVCLLPALAGAQEPRTPYPDLIAAYKKGDVSAAVAGLKTLTSSPEATGIMNDWLVSARRARRVADIQVVLMLYTESALDGFSEGLTLGLRSWFVQQAAIHHIVGTLRSLGPATPFMRAWYLLWESLEQGSGIRTTTNGTEYLRFALEYFPDDPEVLLAAGSREEMRWWNWPDNPQRRPSGGDTSDKRLQTAADWLRRSVAADPLPLEPRLRLGRVLFLLGDSQTAEIELRRSTSETIEPGFRYLGFLFLGDLLERRGDHVSAATAYRSAIGLIPGDQSARVAAAQLAHKEGRRAEAAQEIGRALTRPPTGPDPWWLYTRGQWWRLEQRLADARALVRR